MIIVSIIMINGTENAILEKFYDPFHCLLVLKCINMIEAPITKINKSMINKI